MKERYFDIKYYFFLEFDDLCTDFNKFKLKIVFIEHIIL